MDYEITISDRKTYLYIRPKRPVTNRLAVDFTKAAVDLGKRNNIHKHLLDVRGLSTVSGVLGKWQFSNIEVKDINLPRFWKIAALYDEGDTEVPFIETAMQNAGYRYKVFTDEKEAVTWLEKD